MRKFEEPILVTRPFLPDLAEFREGLEEVWNNRWLTNDGPVVGRFHRALADYLKVPETNLALFVHGTLALELGYQVMGLVGGEVITTPFTFVATAHALKRVGATPVFADIDPETLCLDPAKVEPLITSRTKAIVPVHVFGHVCDIAGFRRLSEKYGIPVIYDAAHAFGVRVEDCNDPPLTLTSDLDLAATIGACGDMSMFSFHATKLFHSCEGGLLVFRDASVQDRLFELRNFAIRSETSCTAVGTNAKMNELQALMGLLCLRKMPDILAKRHAIHDAYAGVFESEPTLRLFPCSANKAYVPVLFETSEICARIYAELKAQCNVFTRRRFYPLLTDFAPYRYAQRTCPVAEDIASRILLLPTYHDLPLEDVRDVARDILEMMKAP